MITFSLFWARNTNFHDVYFTGHPTNVEGNETGSFRLALFLPSPCQPLLQRLGFFTGGKPGQEAGHSQVLVQIGPVDVSAVAKNLKTIALLGCAVPQARILNQGHDNGASVHQIHRQGLFSDGDVSRPRFPFLIGQRTHIIPLVEKKR